MFSLLWVYFSHASLAQDRLHRFGHFGAPNPVLCQKANCSQCRDLSKLSVISSGTPAFPTFVAPIYGTIMPHFFHQPVMAQINRGTKGIMNRHSLFLKIERMRLHWSALHMGLPASQTHTILLGCGRRWATRRVVGAHNTTEPRRKVVMFCQYLDVESMRQRAVGREFATYCHHILLLFRGPDVAWRSISTS